MTSELDLKKLIERKRALIDSFDDQKKERCMNSYNECLKQLKRYHRLENAIDDEQKPPADLPGAINSLNEIGKLINNLVSELEAMLDEKPSVIYTRETTPHGSIGGNGIVYFRTYGPGFVKVPGVLTHDEIEKKKKDKEHQHPGSYKN